jgi:hypothetical protein
MLLTQPAFLCACSLPYVPASRRTLARSEQLFGDDGIHRKQGEPNDDHEFAKGKEPRNPGWALPGLRYRAAGVRGRCAGHFITPPPPPHPPLSFVAAFQFEAFHVFKVFVANPKKPAPIVQVRRSNHTACSEHLRGNHTHPKSFAAPLWLDFVREQGQAYRLFGAVSHGANLKRRRDGRFLPRYATESAPLVPLR